MSLLSCKLRDCENDKTMLTKGNTSALRRSKDDLVVVRCKYRSSIYCKKQLVSEKRASHSLMYVADK